MGAGMRPPLPSPSSTSPHPRPSPANPTQLTKNGLGGNEERKGGQGGEGCVWHLFVYGGELDYLVATPLYCSANAPLTQILANQNKSHTHRMTKSLQAIHEVTSSISCLISLPGS